MGPGSSDQAWPKEPSLGVRVATRPQCGQLMRTSRPGPNQGLHLVSSFRKHWLPALLSQRLSSRGPSPYRAARCLHSGLGNAAAGAIPTGFALASVTARWGQGGQNGEAGPGHGFLPREVRDLKEPEPRRGPLGTQPKHP